MRLSYQNPILATVLLISLVSFSFAAEEKNPPATKEKRVIELKREYKNGTLSYLPRVFDGVLYVDIVNKLGKDVFVAKSHFGFNHIFVFDEKTDYRSFEAGATFTPIFGGGGQDFKRLAYHEWRDETTTCGCSITRIAKQDISAHPEGANIEFEIELDAYVRQWDEYVTFRISHQGPISELKAEEKKTAAKWINPFEDSPAADPIAVSGEERSLEASPTGDRKNTSESD